MVLSDSIKDSRAGQVLVLQLLGAKLVTLSEAKAYYQPIVQQLRGAGIIDD